ncbi:MAG: DNA topoisomerase IV subunit A [Phycisphaerales bacterium]|nr:DNA topoisomerase IV subunit A [Phycisphaerales bacterium]MCB9862504.1 DNA topoisomerase IV subunit A [Phycisphaerales bacterium]
MARKKVRRTTADKKKSPTPKRSSTSSTRRKPDAKSEKARKKINDETSKRIVGLATNVAATAKKRKDPEIVVPMRSLSNASYNKKKRIIEMGDKAINRNFFDLNRSKTFMQTVLIASGCKQLIDADKTSSIRGLYYLSKHSIKGTNEKTFNDQKESDPIIEDLEVSLEVLREQLHVFADSRGSIAGNLTIVSRGDEIDLRRMGAGGMSIPGIVEPDVFQFKKCDAKFILHVEKGTVWARFNEDRFWETHNCILTHGSGQPPRGVRRLLHRMHNELKLPVYCLLDNDPWGYYIYSVIKQGSINLAFESGRMAVPDAKFIGVRSRDYEEFDLSDDVKIAIDDKDIKRSKQILAYPWFKGKKPWEKEIAEMLQHGFKMEVEALLTKSITFVTDEYVPTKLKQMGKWLD